MDEVDRCIKNNFSWETLPENVRGVLGDSRERWNGRVRQFSVDHSLKWKGNVISLVMKEQEYYTTLLAHHHTHLRLYPYHVATEIMRHTKTTNFVYYVDMLERLIKSERSYDMLPNFTAQDSLRLVGIGRNQYIDLMNKCRAKGWLWNKKSSYIRDELPKRPLPVVVEPWWLAVLTMPASEILSKSSKIELTGDERAVVQQMDGRMVNVSVFPQQLLLSLFQQGCVHFVVPIEDADVVSIPPLQGFVMNRSTDDVFEQLLYRIFVTVDGKTSVSQLAELLCESTDKIRDAVSLYCRLGFAKRVLPGSTPTPSSVAMAFASSPLASLVPLEPSEHRICFLVDRTIAALLMMGNLSAELKPHAVTLYEVGKLAAEDMPAFLRDLAKSQQAPAADSSDDDPDLGLSEFFDQANALHKTLAYLHGKFPTDVVRFESLQTLQPDACQRLLDKNYSVLFSMLPTAEVVPAANAATLPLHGPPSLSFHSPWFRLFLYNKLGFGPVALLFPKGFRIVELPAQLMKYPMLRVERMGHEDASDVALEQLLLFANNALLSAPILIQPSTTKAQLTSIVVPTTASHKTLLNGQHQQIVSKVISCLGLTHTLGRVVLCTSDADVFVESLQLGIPLTSIPQNQAALDAIEEFQLLNTEATSIHIKSMETLATELVAFIDAHSTKHSDLCWTSGQPETAMTLPLPSHPVMFDGTKLECLPDPFDGW